MIPSWRFAKGRARHFDWSILESFCREMAAFRRRGGDDETAPDKLSRHVDRIRDHSDAALDTMGCGASAPVSAATPVEKAPESSTGTTRAPSLPRRDHFAPSTCLIRAPTDASLTDTPLPTPRHPPSSPRRAQGFRRGQAVEARAQEDSLEGEGCPRGIPPGGQPR